MRRIQRWVDKLNVECENQNEFGWCRWDITDLEPEFDSYGHLSDIYTRDYCLRQYKDEKLCNRCNLNIKDFIISCLQKNRNVEDIDIIKDFLSKKFTDFNSYYEEYE